MSDYVIAPVTPTHRQILRAAHAVLNRAPTPDEYRDFYSSYQEMLSDLPNYGLVIAEACPPITLKSLGCIDLDAALHQQSE